MIIGCPTEIKTRENRVGIIPASVAHSTNRSGQWLNGCGFFPAKIAPPWPPVP